MNRALSVVTSYAASIFSGGMGQSVGRSARQPAELLKLYEFEGCPFCRKVRVALSEMDLDAMVYPCPKNGPRYRAFVREHGGKAQFPFLMDPNTGKEMYESNDVIRYLASEYGDGRVPFALSLGPVSSMLSSGASAARVGRGSFYRGVRAPEQPLEVYSFEASPYCRLVREAMSELEIPYVLHNVAKGSAKREAFVERSGKMMVPYMVDPNTGAAMFESADIVAYLDKTYGAG